MPTWPMLFLQSACWDHHYIRSRDLDAIVERPQRLRAVALGLAAALARLESLSSSSADLDALAGALDRLSIAVPAPRTHAPVLIVRSTASVDLIHDPAVRFIHGDTYPAQLSRWALDSREAIAHGASEIPEGLPQGDLYLCPESIGAMQGAVGTVCEAVDNVVTSASDRRAFVVVRPPGHHCGEDSPAGFCFVNNVAVGAAHAHLKHGVNRVVILDIDLHHGNGTQALVWRINEETHRRNLEAAAGAPHDASASPGLQMYYGSIHDVLSYPCEDGSAQHIAAASLCIHGAHGQHIENVHLQPYAPSPSGDGDKHFWDVLYAKEYARILHRAAEFLERTGGQGDDVLVFISCGMDASEHEHPSMSRHARTVPTTFFARFARDACALADKYARGRIVSVLEGGYSDRALIGGAMAHLCGLVDADTEEGWWGVQNLVVLEKAMKRLRRRREEQEQEREPWLVRTLEIFKSLDESTKAKVPVSVPPSSMTLRERKTRVTVPESSSSSSSSSSEGEGAGAGAGAGKGDSAQKRLPRVILRLGPDPSLSTAT